MNHFRATPTFFVFGQPPNFLLLSSHRRTVGELQQGSYHSGFQMVGDTEVFSLSDTTISQIIWGVSFCGHQGPTSINFPFSSVPLTLQRAFNQTGLLPNISYLTSFEQKVNNVFLLPSAIALDGGQSEVWERLSISISQHCCQTGGFSTWKQSCWWNGWRLQCQGPGLLTALPSAPVHLSTPLSSHIGIMTCILQGHHR